MDKWTLNDMKNEIPPTESKQCAYIKVGLSSCGIAAGAQDVYDFLSGEVTRRSLPVKVLRCGCSGMCYAEPLVEVCVEGVPAVTYGRVTTQIAARILDEHIQQKRLVNDSVVEMMVRRQEGL